MKKYLLFIFLIACSYIINAQKIKFSYGGLLGINNSFLDSKAYISQDYLSMDPSYIRNLSLSKASNNNFGYNLGFYLNAQPENSRLSLETGLLIANLNNSYTLSVSWEQYYATTGNYWGPVNETEKITNGFSILNMPFILGYDLIKKDNYKFTIFTGAAPNISMKNDHIKYDSSMQEIYLYKSSYLSYQSGISLNFNKIFVNLKYDRSQNIKKTMSRDYFPYSMNVEKLYLNFFSISFGIKLN
jgi:Outer membrane protein beta-barrel domain